MADPMRRHDLHRRLREAADRTGELMDLQRNVSDALAEIAREVGGAASGRDRRIRIELDENLAELAATLNAVRIAVTEGEAFAAHLE